MRLLAIALTTLVALFATVVPAKATPFTVGGVTYWETSLSEVVTATFTKPDGGDTTKAYSGLVEINVSGVGQSRGTDSNDAFYVFSGGPLFTDPNYYQMTAGDTTLVGLNPSQDVKNFIVYDIDASSNVVSRPYVPAYQTSHAYSFIVDTALLGVTTPEVLHFGVSDGIFSDNSGAYTIDVTQLAAVPEPATLALLGTGLLVVARRRRRSC